MNKKLPSEVTASRTAQAQIFAPLRTYLAAHFRRTPYRVVGKTSGLPLHEVQRILGAKVKSPTYVDVTQLAVAAGLTPNEAAHMCHLYTPPKKKQPPLEETVSPEIRQLAEGWERLPEDVQGRLLQNWYNDVEVYMEHLGREGKGLPRGRHAPKVSETLEAVLQ